MDIFRAFWDGFTRPRMIALAGIFLVVFAQAALLTSPFLARVDVRYLMAGPNDYGAEVTSGVMRIRRARADGRTMVVHVGGSFSQEAIDEPKGLNRDLSDALGQPVHYWPLFIPDASLWDLGALIDQVPSGSRGYAVIEVNPGLIGDERHYPDRLVKKGESVLDSPFVEEEMRKAGLPVPRRTGIALVDHAGFFSARRDNLWRWALEKPATESVLHRWSTSTVRTIEREDEFAELAQDYEKKAAINDVTLEKIVKLAQSRGLDVILLEGRYRPGSLRNYPEAKLSYERNVAREAATLDVPVIDPATAAGLVYDDYVDPYHLWHRPARLKFQSAFVQELSDVIRKKEGHHAS